MERYTIYSKGIWERILEKHPDLKALAIKCGCENNPQKAQEIREAYKHSFGFGKLSEVERQFAIRLVTVEFKEDTFLKHVVSTGTFHNQNGASDYAMAAFDLVLIDFEASFKEWYIEIQKRNMLENPTFQEYYELFLEIIKLKLDYKIPYTKLFIQKLLQCSAAPKEDSLEIRNYLEQHHPDVLLEVKNELIE